jgi:S1-C subfamily serine protease
VRRPYLGLVGQARPLDRRLARLHNLDNAYAVEIVSLEPRAPASAAGLREGDLIVSVNDDPIMSVDDLHRFLAVWPIGAPMRISAVRGVECVEVAVTPVEAP